LPEAATEEDDTAGIRNDDDDVTSGRAGGVFVVIGNRIQ